MLSSLLLCLYAALIKRKAQALNSSSRLLLLYSCLGVFVSALREARERDRENGRCVHRLFVPIVEMRSEPPWLLSLISTEIPDHGFRMASPETHPLACVQVPLWSRLFFSFARSPYKTSLRSTHGGHRVERNVFVVRSAREKCEFPVIISFPSARKTVLAASPPVVGVPTLLNSEAHRCTACSPTLCWSEGIFSSDERKRFLGRKAAVGTEQIQYARAGKRKGATTSSAHSY